MDNQSVKNIHRQTLKRLVAERKIELNNEFNEFMPIQDISNMLTDTCIETEQYQILEKYNFNWKYLLKSQRKHMPGVEIMKHFFFDMEYHEIISYFKMSAEKNEYNFINIVFQYYDYIQTNRKKNRYQLNRIMMHCLRTTIRKKNISVIKVTRTMEELVKRKLFCWEYYSVYIYNKKFINFDKKNKYKLDMYYNFNTVRSTIKNLSPESMFFS